MPDITYYSEGNRLLRAKVAETPRGKNPGIFALFFQKPYKNPCKQPDSLYHVAPSLRHFPSFLFTLKESVMAKGPTKGEIIGSIAGTTQLARKQVSSVFESLSGLIGKNIGKKGPGIFVVPGLMKIT